MKKACLYLFIFIIMAGFGIGSASAKDIDDFQETIQTLIDFDIIDGEIDDIDASEKLTRGTAAVWLYNLIEVEGEASKSSFTDVLVGTKTADAIISLKDMGLVAGYGDGTFKPKNAITYQEYTKLLVDLLGYKNVASSGMWQKNGYAEMVSRLELNDGVSCGVNQELSVGEGAKILYNALHAEMIMNKKTLLENYKGICWIEGRVVQNAYTGLSDAKGAGQGFITIGDYTYKNGKSEYNQMLGKTVTAYYRSNSDGDKIVHIKCKKNVSELIINSNSIDAEQSDRTKMVYEESVDGRKKTVRIAASADVIYNEKANPDLEAGLFYPKCGEIRLVDSDNDGVYDIVFITDYQLFFVSHASESSRTIYNQYSGDGFTSSIELDDEAILEIFDGDGETLEFSDIQENKIALIAHSKTGTEAYCKIVLSDQFYKGMIQSIDTDKIKIADKELELSEIFKEAVETGVIKAIEPSKEYTVYLDAFGKAAAYDMNYSGVHYGYLKVAYTEPGEDEVYVKIFDESGEWKLLTVKKNVLVDNVKRTRMEFLNIVETKNLVRYNINSNMEITSLDNAVQLSDDDTERAVMIENDIFRKALLNSTSNNNKYYSNNKSFSNEFFMEEDAVIFLIPTGDNVSDKDFSVTDRSYLSSEKRYDLTVYDPDEYMFSEIYAMYYDTSSVAGLESILSHDDYCMIVSKVGVEFVNGEAVSVAHGWVNGQEWSYTGADETTFSDVKKGDIIRSKYDDSGNLSKYIMVHRLGNEDVTTNVDDVNNAIYMTGTTLSVDFAERRVRIREGKDRTIVLPASVLVTVYEKKERQIRTGVLQDINPGDYLVFRMRSSVPQEIFIIKE